MFFSSAQLQHHLYKKTDVLKTMVSSSNKSIGITIHLLRNEGGEAVNFHELWMDRETDGQTYNGYHTMVKAHLAFSLHLLNKPSNRVSPPQICTFGPSCSLNDVDIQSICSVRNEQL